MTSHELSFIPGSENGGTENGTWCSLPSKFQVAVILKPEKEIEQERNKFKPLPLNLFVSQTGYTGGSRGGRGRRGGRGGRGGGCSKDFFNQILSSVTMSLDSYNRILDYQNPSINADVNVDM